MKHLLDTIKIEQTVRYRIGNQVFSLDQLVIVLVQNAIRGSTGANGEENFAEYFKHLDIQKLKAIKAVIDWRLEQIPIR